MRWFWIFCLAVNAALCAAVPASASCRRDTLKVALDIGHDRTRSGATSARGVSEFFYNQALGRLARSGLHEAGFPGAFLIGESGAPLRLTDRTRIAREQGADLFISLHHDSAQKHYFATWTVDGHERPYSDTFHGFSVFVSTAWGKPGGLAVARGLARGLLARGLSPALHHAEPIAGENRTLLDPALGIYAFNELAVLRTASMPALLLEAGLIVNRAEEAAIKSGQYHPKIVAALIAAVTEFCGAATGPARL